jgi:hypothetical protein
MSVRIDTDMGKVLTTLVIISRADQIRAEDGTILPEQVPIGHSQKCFSRHGCHDALLTQRRDRATWTQASQRSGCFDGDGIGKAQIFRDATISLREREGTFECLELPGGQDPLLGVIPLEALGIELDLQNQTLRVLPISPTETYLTIYGHAILG